MILTTEEAARKLEKIADDRHTRQFEVSTKGTLLIKAKGRSVEVADFVLFFNGQLFFHRCCDTNTSEGRPETERLCFALSGAKFIANRSDGGIEYAKPGKALSPDFSIVLVFRSVETTNLFIADGEVAETPFYVSLADSARTDNFCEAMLLHFVTRRSPAISTKIREVFNHGKAE